MITAIGCGGAIAQVSAAAGTIAQVTDAGGTIAQVSDAEAGDAQSQEKGVCGTAGAQKPRKRRNGGSGGRAKAEEKAQ